MIYMVWSVAACAATVKPFFLQRAEAAIEVNPVIKPTGQPREGATTDPAKLSAACPNCGNVDGSKHIEVAVRSHLFGGAPRPWRSQAAAAIETATHERPENPWAALAEKNLDPRNDLRK